MSSIERSADEIQAELEAAENECNQVAGDVGYEEGVRDALSWVLGEADSPITGE